MAKYTLNQIKENPNILTFEIPWNNKVLVLRPLEPSDTEILANFLQELSPETRKHYKLEDYGLRTAEEFCSSIAVYDKLRFVLLSENEVIGLFEFSMDIPESDKIRLSQYEVSYPENQMCRYGPCLADRYQGKGLAKHVFPYIKEIALKTGNSSILLWGGVFKENVNAIKYYKKVGFKELGEFTNQDNVKCLDMILKL